MQDHINFTIGRQSFNLKQLENATAAFKHLLTVDSKQSPPQQAAFLREYLFVYRVSVIMLCMFRLNWCIAVCGILNQWTNILLPQYHC